MMDRLLSFGLLISFGPLNTDSPSSKLLYAKELQDYKPAVRKFYSDIQVIY